MARGLEVIEDLLPGLTGELAAHGAPLVDPRLHGRWFLNGGYHDRRLVAAEQPTLLVSRPLLEGVIRERVLCLPNVRAIARCDVVGLISDDTRRRVIGVRVLRRQAGSAQETVPADVVVDASGRRSRTPAWLEALGYPSPVEEQVRVDLTYTSRRYRRRTADLDGDDFAMVFPDPTTRRAGVVAAQDGDRWRSRSSATSASMPRPTTPGTTSTRGRWRRRPVRRRWPRRTAQPPGGHAVPGQPASPLRPAADIPRGPRRHRRRGCAASTLSTPRA